MDISKIWAETQQLIKNAVGETTFETWFGLLQAKSLGTKTIGIEVPDEFFKDWLVKNYLCIIKESVCKAANASYAIEFSINPQLLKKTTRSRIKAFESRIKATEPENLKLNPRYTFNEFVVGSCNRFCHAASMAVAESPAKTYNPLFIYGGVGLGKTHLMQAICHFLLAKDKNVKITYMPSERFTNELISAIQNRTTAAFRQKYRNADVLVIDDIHFIAGKEATQEEFFHTFNALHDSHKQIVICSDRNPKEIANLEERLVSRFGWGLICDIQPPEFETRVAILKKKIEKETAEVPDDVIYFIAQTVKTNIRELEGALIRVVAYSFLENRPITLESAKDVLRDMVKEARRLITPDLIQKEVAGYFNLSTGDLKARKRNKNLVAPRQIAMYLIRELTELSLPEIGQCFGGKDHTTILYGYNKIKKAIVVDSHLSTQVKTITNTIKQ